jgi:hypothetical protein
VEQRDANGPGFYYVITAAPTITSRNRFRRTATGGVAAASSPSVGGELSFTVKSINQSSFVLPPLSSTTAYLFRIYSANDIGQSSASSSLVIGKEVPDSKKPTSVEAYFYDNNRYEVRWAYPSAVPELAGAIVSWCAVNHTKSIDKCSHPLQSAVITRPMQMAHTITVAEDLMYQFGVSVNYKDNTSSPVTWADCIVPIGIKQLGKLHNFSVRAINSTTVRAAWKLPCKGLQAVVSKFEVLYCRISFHNNSCSDFVSREVVGGASEFLTIDSLEPLTAYRFVMRAWTESAAGFNSDPVDETTFGAETSFWATFFYLLLLLSLVLMVVAAIFSLVRWYRRMVKNMKAPIVLPGRLAGEKIDFSNEDSYEPSDKRRTRDSAGNLFNASYGFFDDRGSTSSLYDDLVQHDANQIPAVVTSYDVMTNAGNDLIQVCDRSDSIGMSSFGRFSSEPRNRSRSSAVRPANPEIDELCPGNSSDTTGGSLDSGLEVKKMSAKTRRKRMMRKDSPGTGSSTETSAGTVLPDREKRGSSRQQETSFNVGEDGIRERLSPGSSQNEMENKAINLSNGRTGIPLVNGYVTHDVISKMQEEGRKRVPVPDATVFATSVSLEEDDSAFISDSTTRSSSTDSGDSATDVPASTAHISPFIKNNSGYVSVPVPHLTTSSPAYFT